MIETKDYHINVLIEGALLFDTEVYLRCVDLVAFSVIDKSDCEVVIMGDKTFENTDHKYLSASSDLLCYDNAIYHATGDIIAYQDGGIAKDSPYFCINSFNSDLKEIIGLLNQDFDHMTKRIINRMIYLNILSIYEFFISDICSTCFLRFEDIRHSYYEKKVFRGKTFEAVESKMLELSHKAHINMMQSVFSIEIPDMEIITKAYDTRNDIAHRYKSTKKREYISVEVEDVYNLADATKGFVYEIFERITEKVYTK